MALLIPIFALFGLCVGSFLNVCIDRLPKGQSIINPPSHCDACQHKLGFLDLIPLFSYLWLRGRCRYCQVRIPQRIPIVEGVTGLLFALIYWKFGLGMELVIALIYAALFLITFVIDLEHMDVLGIVVYPAMALALGFSLLWPGLSGLNLPGGWIVGKLASSLVGGAIGAGAMALPYFVSYLVYRREGMGKGDIQLGALVGLMTGYPLTVVALSLAVISGGFVGSWLLVFKIKKRTDRIPFAPFLVTSAMVTLLWGQTIYQWYMG